MKIELEITEEQVREALESLIKKGLREYIYSKWSISNQVKKAFEEYESTVIQEEVAACYENRDQIREQAEKQLKRRIQNQLNKLMKEEK